MLFPVFLAILIFLFGSKVIYAAEKTEKEAQLEEKMDRWMYLTDLVEQIESQK